MTTFVDFAEARRLPEIRAAYNEPAFRDAAISEAQGSAVWARYKAGVAPASGDLAIEIDLDALPESV